LDLSAVSGVTVNLAGNNSFTSVNTNSSNTCGIYSSGTFTIISTTGTGTLTATSVSSSNGHSVGIFSTGLTVNSGTVYANSTNGYSNFAIHIGIADGPYMVVNGGSVIATVVLKIHLSRAVFLESASGYLNITGGTATASGYTSSYGIYSSNTDTTAPAVTISGGTITASGGNYGLIAANSHQISISGGTLDLTSVNRAFSKAPIFPAHYRYKIGDDTNYIYSWNTEYSYDTSHKHVLIKTRSQPYTATVTNGTADKSVYEASETVTITYEEIPDEGNNDNSGSSGNSGCPDIAPPRREEYIEPTEPENDKDR
jgi:hypothetical protein